jgi:LPS export ABC transporter protein LptC
MFKNLKLKHILETSFLIFSVFLACSKSEAFAENKNVNLGESEQQISDFSLAGYGEEGKKKWDISGKSADVFTETVKLTNVTGNMYGKEEDIKLTADKGDFNKTDSKVHLEHNVVITTTKGTKLTTDSLDWDRKNQVVSTQDTVNIERENIFTVGRGARGETNLKRVALEKDIRLDINPAKPNNKEDSAVLKEKITITCDGPLEIDYEKNVATFNNNVKVDRQDSVIFSDRMDVFFITAKDKEEIKKDAGQASGFMGNKIDKIVARGNVKVIRGENISYSEEAIYTAADRKIVLKGRPKLVIYSTEDIKDASSGN